MSKVANAVLNKILAEQESVKDTSEALEGRDKAISVAKNVGFVFAVLIVLVLTFRFIKRGKKK